VIVDSFHKFVDACPKLEKVKFDYFCEGIHLYDILYLLNHTNAINSIDAYFDCDYRDMGVNEIEEEEVERINNVATRSLILRSLISRSLNDLDESLNATYLLSIFEKCPMLEKVAVDFWEIVDEAIFSTVAWREMIANNWQHLQSLTYIMLNGVISLPTGKISKYLAYFQSSTSRRRNRYCQQ